MEKEGAVPRLLNPTENRLETKGCMGRQQVWGGLRAGWTLRRQEAGVGLVWGGAPCFVSQACLLYTSDAADDWLVV